MQTIAKLEEEDFDVTLARAVINFVDTSEDWAEANRKLNSVRPYCRQLRAALVELNRSDSADNANKARTHCRYIRAVFLEMDPSATIPFNCNEPSCSVLLSPRTTCWLDHLRGLLTEHHRSEHSSDDSIALPTLSVDGAAHPSDIEASAQELAASDMRTSPSMLRQSMGLFGLELAYFQYYFVDVQLQILNLPSLFPT